MVRDPFAPLIKAAHALCDLHYYDLAFKTADLARDAILDDHCIQSLRQEQVLIALHERIWCARNMGSRTMHQAMAMPSP